LKEFVHRFFDDHQQAREVGDSGGIGVGKADGTPINMCGRGWHGSNPVSVFTRQGKETTTPRGCGA
jgi:hypothetical protein